VSPGLELPFFDPFDFYKFPLLECPLLVMSSDVQIRICMHVNRT